MNDIDKPSCTLGILINHQAILRLVDMEE